MLGRFLLVALPTLWLGDLAGAQAGAGARLFRTCVSCHGTPDPAAPGDSLWIQRIGTTACVQPPAPGGARQRAALMAFLRGRRVKRPRRVAHDGEPGPGQGRVVSSVAWGSILLVPAGRAGRAPAVRLVWSPSARGSPARLVPSGRYVVRNYRVLRRDARGAIWQIWGSGKHGRRVRVAAGETVRLDLDLAVRVKPSAAAGHEALRLGLAVTGDSHMGLTVIQDGKRVPVTYRVAAHDVVLARGGLDYG